MAIGKGATLVVVAVEPQQVEMQDIGMINADTGRHRVSLPEPLKEAVCAVSTECSCYAGRLSGLILCGSCSGYHSCCSSIMARRHCFAGTYNCYDLSLLFSIGLGKSL